MIPSRLQPILASGVNRQRPLVVLVSLPTPMLAVYLLPMMESTFDANRIANAGGGTIVIWLGGQINSIPYGGAT